MFQTKHLLNQLKNLFLFFGNYQDLRYEGAVPLLPINISLYLVIKQTLAETHSPFAHIYGFSGELLKK